jgi:hypothetical protein
LVPKDCTARTLSTPFGTTLVHKGQTGRCAKAKVDFFGRQLSLPLHCGAKLLWSVNTPLVNTGHLDRSLTFVCELGAHFLVDRRNTNPVQRAKPPFVPFCRHRRHAAINRRGVGILPQTTRNKSGTRESFRVGRACPCGDAVLDYFVLQAFPRRRLPLGLTGLID